MKKLNLEDIKKEKDLFTVPDRYFDTLPSKIQAKIQAQNTKKSWFQRLLQKDSQLFIFAPKKIALVCGMALAILVGSKIFAPQRAIMAETHQLAEVPEADIRNYLLENGVATEEIMQMCVKEGTELTIDGLPSEISQEVFEEELNPEDLADIL